jgi:hypothetical protein
MIIPFNIMCSWFFIVILPFCHDIVGKYVPFLQCGFRCLVSEVAAWSCDDLITGQCLKNIPAYTVAEFC